MSEQVRKSYDPAYHRWRFKYWLKSKTLSYTDIDAQVAWGEIKVGEMPEEADDAEMPEG